MHTVTCPPSSRVRTQHAGGSSCGPRDRTWLFGASRQKRCGCEVVAVFRYKPAPEPHTCHALGTHAEGDTVHAAPPKCCGCSKLVCSLEGRCYGISSFFWGGGVHSCSLQSCVSTPCLCSCLSERTHWRGVLLSDHLRDVVYVIRYNIFLM